MKNLKSRNKRRVFIYGHKGRLFYARIVREGREKREGRNDAEENPTIIDKSLKLHVSLEDP